MEVLALALGTAIMVATAVLTVLFGRGVSGRRLPTVDPRLQASVQALSGDGRVRLEPFSVRGHSGIAVVVKGICDKLWLSREDTEGRPPEVPVELSEDAPGAATLHSDSVSRRPGVRCGVLGVRARRRGRSPGAQRSRAGQLVARKHFSLQTLGKTCAVTRSS